MIKLLPRKIQRNIKLPDVFFSPSIFYIALRPFGQENNSTNPLKASSDVRETGNQRSADIAVNSAGLCLTVGFIPKDCSQKYSIKPGNMNINVPIKLSTISTSYICLLSKFYHIIISFIMRYLNVCRLPSRLQPPSVTIQKALPTCFESTPPHTPDRCLLTAT